MPSWRDRIGDLWNRVTAPSNPDTGYRYAIPTTAGTTVTHENVFKLPAYMRGATLLAGSVAQLPWHVNRMKPDGSRERAANHAVEWVLQNQANEEMTSFAWRETAMMHVLTAGNHYSEIEFNNRNGLANLWPLVPERVEPKRDDADRLFYRVWNPRGTYTDLSPSHVFHIHGPGWDGVSGFDTVAMAGESLGLAKALEEFASTFFGNGANPGLVIKLKNKPTTDGLKRMRAEINEMHGGPRRAHKVAFTEVGAEIEKMTTAPEQSQFLESREHQVTEMARIMGVPPHLIADLRRCMPADTLVMTENGPRPIVDVRAGERVWSVGQDGLYLARVLNNWENGVDDLLAISTTNRRFRCNRKHRVLVRRPYERALRPGEVGGKNVGGAKVRVEWRNEYIPAGWLREGDVLVALDRIPDTDCVTAPNGRVLTEGFMAFCGLLMGDGSVTKSKGQAVGVQIARADNARYMDYYRSVMLREFAGMRMLGRRVVGGESISAAAMPMHLIEATRQTAMKSVAVGSELVELGLSGTARTKRVPGWVFGLSEPLRLAFLRGFFDADGTVNKLGRMACDSCNPLLLEDVRHLCMSAGVPVTNVQTVIVDPKISGGFGTDTCVMYRFTCSDPAQNVRIGSHDPADMAKLTSGRTSSPKGRAYPRSGGESFQMEGVTMTKIVKIECHKPEPVYDIEVEGGHCFFADGVQVHNSTNNNIEHQSREFLIYGLMPWVLRFEQEANRKLFGENRASFFTKMNVNAFMRGDQAARAQYYKDMILNGVFTVNDVRRLEDMDPIGPEGDAHLVQGQMMNLKDAGRTVEETEPALPGEQMSGYWHGPRLPH